MYLMSCMYGMVVVGSFPHFGEVGRYPEYHKHAREVALRKDVSLLGLQPQGYLIH